MLPPTASLEDTLDLGSIGLFLNQFDLTMAFAAAFTENDMREALKYLAEAKPLRSFKRVLNNKGIRQQLSVKMRQYDSDHIVRFRNSQSSVSAGELLYLSLLNSGVAQTIIYAGGPIESDEPLPALPFKITIKLRDDLVRAIYRSLGQFLNYAREELFPEYNELVYEDFAHLFRTTNLCEDVNARGLGSALGLYLQMHTDLRISFLSLFFTQNNVDELAEKMVFGKIIDDKIEFVAGTLARPDVEKGLSGRKRISELLGLRPDSLYQPERHPICPLIANDLLNLDLEALLSPGMSCFIPLVHRGMLLMKYRMESYGSELGQMKDDRIQREAAQARQHSDLQEAYRVRNRAQEELASTNIELERLRSRPPSQGPGQEYKRLLAQYQTLSRAYAHAETQTLAAQEAAEKAHETGERLAKTVRGQNAIITDLEGQVNRLSSQIRQHEAVAALRKKYAKSTALLICGMPYNREQYHAALGDVFQEVAVIDQSELRMHQTQSYDQYDVIIMSTDGTNHSSRAILESANRHVTVYPGRPAGIIDFLYRQIEGAITS